MRTLHLKPTLLLLGAVFLPLSLMSCSDDSPLSPDSAQLNGISHVAGHYTRVDRMGMPAIATAVIASKDAYNNADPGDDAGGDRGQCQRAARRAR